MEVSEKLNFTDIYLVSADINFLPPYAMLTSKVKREQIEITKKYRLQCLKCKKFAKFDEEKLLDEFLKDRVKQKLIYSFYWQEFAKFTSERDSEKILEGHIEDLCEKCQELGKHCGGGTSYRGQISQVVYTPPFLKW